MKNITDDKSVNLASLLIPSFSTSQHSGTDKPDRVDPRLNRDLTLSEFIQAFGIYKNILCDAFQQRRAELDLYDRDLVDMGVKYRDKLFCEYHRQCSSTAADIYISSLIV